MDARQARRGKRISLQQEKRAAAELGGKVTAGSGAAKFSGGADVRVMGKTRVECKFTENDDYILKFAELEKLRKQAQKHLEFPVFQFAFRETSGRLTQYAVIQWSEEGQPLTNWETDKKGLVVEKLFLGMAVGAGTVRVAFHVKEGNSLRSRYYRVMRWDDFVEWNNKNNA